MKRRRIGAVAGVAAALLVVVAGLGFSGLVPAFPRSGTAIQVPDPHGYAVPVAVGETITDAFDLVVLMPSQEIVVDAVSADYEGSGLRTVGSALSDPNRTEGVPTQFYRQWPPTDPELGVTSEVEGTPVSPMADGYVSPQVLLGTEVVAPGHHLRRGIWVSYHVGPVHYRQFLPAEITFCTPDALVGDDCPFLGGGAS